MLPGDCKQGVTGQAEWGDGPTPRPRLHPQVWMGQAPGAVACSVCLTEVEQMWRTWGSLPGHSA